MTRTFALVLILAVTLQLSASNGESPAALDLEIENEVAPGFVESPMSWNLVDEIDGCELCRGGDCTHAINNQSAGVFCGDLKKNHQPCCCPYVTTCAVDQFDDVCHCKQPDQLEHMLFDFWKWAIIGLVVLVFFPFAIVLELLVRVFSVFGLHCQRLGGSCTNKQQPITPAYIAVALQDAMSEVHQYRVKPETEVVAIC